MGKIATYSWILIAWLWATSLIAQEDYTLNTPYRNLAEQTWTVILSPTATIYTAPSTAATSLVQLPLGTPVFITARMDELQKINGFKTNWYQVQFQQDSIWETGFVWGGSLAVAIISGSEDPALKLFYGVSHLQLVSRGDYEEEAIYLRLIAFKDGQCLDSLRLEAMGTLYTKTGLQATGNRGLKGVMEVLELSFGDGYCGGVSATQTIFWDGRQLHAIDLLSNGYSSRSFSNHFFRYPTDQEGLPNTILLCEEAGRIEDKKAIYTHQKQQAFHWNGQRLVPAKP